MILCKLEERHSEKVRLLARVDAAVFEQSAVNRLKLLSNSSVYTGLEFLANIQHYGYEVLWPVRQDSCGSRDELPLILQASASVGDQTVPPQCPDNKQHRTQVHRHKLVPRERQRILIICGDPENLSPNDVKKGRICFWK